VRDDEKIHYRLVSVQFEVNFSVKSRSSALSLALKTIYDNDKCIAFIGLVAVI